MGSETFCCVFCFCQSQLFGSVMDSKIETKKANVILAKKDYDFLLFWSRIVHTVTFHFFSRKTVIQHFPKFKFDFIHEFY